MVILIDSYGASLGRQNGGFVLEKGAERRQVSPYRVSAIHVRRACEVSSAAVLLAAEHGIPVLFFDRRGKVMARLWQSRFGGHVSVRRGQLRWSESAEGLAWVAARLVEKVKGQAAVLSWLAEQVPDGGEELDRLQEELEVWRKRLAAGPGSKQAVRAAEGQSGRLYWEGYFGALRSYEQVDGRSRRPARDRLNALLNYGYGMLYGEVESAVLTAGLDPMVGVLHREEYGRPAFVLDVIEPYRGWVDRLVAELVLSGQARAEWFRTDGKGVWLSKPGKQVVVPAWLGWLADRVPVGGKRLRRRDVVGRELMALAGQFRAAEAAGGGEAVEWEVPEVPGEEVDR